MFRTVPYVQTYEVGPGEDVVANEHHSNVRHQDILEKGAAGVQFCHGSATSKTNLTLFVFQKLNFPIGINGKLYNVF